MYAQVVRVQIQPGKADEAITIFKEAILPAVQSRDGLKQVNMLVDRENNRGIGFTLWETKAQVDELASSGFFQEQVGKLATLLAGPPEREVYEVAAGD